MRSAIRWFEAARSGSLKGGNQDIAFQRCVLRSASRTIDTSKLPAGLSAALRNRYPGLSSWHVVPLRGKPSNSPSERAAQELTGADRPMHMAIAETQPSRRVDGSARMSNSYSVLDRSRSKTASGSSPMPRVGNPPAVSTGVSAAASSSAEARLPVAVEYAAAVAVTEPSVRAGLVNERPVPTEGASVAPAPTGKSGPIALQRAIGNKVRSSTALSASLTPRSQIVFKRPRDTPANASEMTLDGISSKAGSSSTSLNLMKSSSSGRNAGSQIKAQFVINQIPVTMVGSAARAFSSDQPLQGHEVVPRRVNGALVDTRMTQAAPATASAVTASRRGHESQYQMPTDRISSHSDAAALPGGQPGMMVTLRGDVLMDGRKMGRLVATGQTSAASLPTLSGSAINLRAMPIFAGTSAPL